MIRAHLVAALQLDFSAGSDYGLRAVRRISVLNQMFGSRLDVMNGGSTHPVLAASMVDLNGVDKLI